MTLAERIKQKRKEKGLTLQQIADKTGIARQTVHKYETGIITNIPADRLELLASVLKTTPAYLIGWNENPATKQNTLSDDNITITEEEKELLKIFRRIPKTDQPPALLLLNSFSRVPKKHKKMVLEMIEVALKQY